MWCTTPPLHNFSIFPNREIQRSFKHTVAFFFLFDRDVEMLALFVACLCHDIDHRGTTNSFQVSSVREITVFVCFSGFVLLCAILFKLKICLFAFCFVFSFVYCSIAFPFYCFQGSTLAALYSSKGSVLEVLAVCLLLLLLLMFLFVCVFFSLFLLLPPRLPKLRDGAIWRKSPQIAFDIARTIGKKILKFH